MQERAEPNPAGKHASFWLGCTMPSRYGVCCGTRNESTLRGQGPVAVRNSNVIQNITSFSVIYLESTSYIARPARQEPA